MVFSEALLGVGALAGNYELSSPRQMVRHVLGLAVDGGDDLGHTLHLQRATLTLGLANFGEVEARGRREAKPVRLRPPTRGVWERRHLDPRLGAVDEGVEHLRVDVAAIGDLQILIEDAPDGLRGGLMVARVIARALAGSDHLKAAGARPVDVFADQRRLVAPGQRIDDARL